MASAGATDVSREPTISSWKDDPSERARRIWIWWRSRLQAKSILPTFRNAIRLVVLVQPSSAAAERAFSQLKLILDVILGKVIRIRGYSANGTQERHSRIRIRIRASFVPHS